MNLPVLIAILVGLSVVCQSGISRKIALSSDLNSALLVNSIVALLISIGIYFLALWRPQMLPEILRPHTKLFHSGLLMLIPGICGFIIICGLPISLSRIGALRALAFVIAAEIVGGLLWDQAIEGIQMNFWRFAGAILTVSGAIITLLF